MTAVIRKASIELCNNCQLNEARASVTRQGNSHIVPITDFAGLRIEGLRQHHCVESYHSRISNGTYYVYQVLAPERATLGVKIHRDLSGRVDLSMDQLQGLQNKPVSHETTQAVLSWLTRRRGTIKRLN